jgi:hypothetical protein
MGVIKATEKKELLSFLGSGGHAGAISLRVLETLRHFLRCGYGRS